MERNDKPIPKFLKLFQKISFAEVINNSENEPVTTKINSLEQENSLLKQEKNEMKE
jgi:hypothetical protein